MFEGSPVRFRKVVQPIDENAPEPDLKPMPDSEDEPEAPDEIDADRHKISMAQDTETEETMPEREKKHKQKVQVEKKEKKTKTVKTVDEGESRGAQSRGAQSRGAQTRPKEKKAPKKRDGEKRVETPEESYRMPIKEDESPPKQRVRATSKESKESKSYGEPIEPHERVYREAEVATRPQSGPKRDVWVQQRETHQRQTRVGEDPDTEEEDTEIYGVWRPGGGPVKEDNYEYIAQGDWADQFKEKKVPRHISGTVYTGSTQIGGHYDYIPEGPETPRGRRIDDKIIGPGFMKAGCKNETAKTREYDATSYKYIEQGEAVEEKTAVNVDYRKLEAGDDGFFEDHGLTLTLIEGW